MRLRWIPAPSELHLLRNLKSFCLRGNYARVHAKDETYSSIPHQFGYLQKLRDLDLGCNNLTGPIPFELFNLKLTLLNLERNKLTGTLPDAISCLSNLKFLNLSFNEMSGKLTPKIGSLTQLFLLDLHRNYFEGDIPIEIGKCISLQKLDLGANKFTGAIPPTLSNLSQLRVLSLTRNSLTGAVPPDLSLLTHLDVLALGGNFLNPIIPIELERLTKLREIHLWWENSSEIEMLQSLAPDSRLRRLLLESAADVEPVGACGGGISVEDTAAESDNESGMYESEEDCDYQPNW
ncbi:hypothetical protein BC830DRAFT_1066833 [Chytriomyces sp. MP71]|nr:hypothetical protein BC830DRAFT_1066833 [Chytriomyces sp. MP71]